MGVVPARPRWSRRLFVWVALAIVACAFVIGAASAGRSRVSIKATPVSSVEDQPVQIHVSGLSAREGVTLTVRSIDGKGLPWVSSTSFRADSRGRLNLARAVAIGGSYQRDEGYPAAWGMGAIATMQPTRPTQRCCYFWGGKQPFTVKVHARGHTVASATFRRQFSTRALRYHHLTLSGDGFIGDYVSPSSVSGKRPAILAFGGSEGGESTLQLAALLAAHGYPALALAYFKEPGLPQTLANIPLEYFAKALSWLGQQPDVDPNRIMTLGISRGSEAALLLGVHYPNLVHGVIALVPANVALCSYPGCGGPAWTLGGQPLPFTSEVDQPRPTDNPAAVIPVEQITGPIFLDCAGRDEVWPSCPYSEAIIKRLDASHDHYIHVRLRFPNAGHLIGTTIPYDPNTVDTLPENEQAREKLWPQLLNFLAHT